MTKIIMMKSFPIVAGLVAAMTLGAVPARAALISNGSFENGISNMPIYVPYDKKSRGYVGIRLGTDNDITGWTRGSAIGKGDVVNYVGNYWMAANGSRSVDFHGNGSIFQSFAAAPDTTYTVYFDISGNPGSRKYSNNDELSVTGGDTTKIFDYKHTPSNSRANMDWKREYFTFTTGAGGPTDLTFSGVIGGGTVALDDVSMVVGVPEPATWALMILGFGGLGLVLRRKTIDLGSPAISAQV